MAPTKTSTEVVVDEIRTEAIELTIIGTSPLILNRMSEKAKRELLMPRGRKTAAQKQSELKHDPMAEFRASPYTLVEDDAPTLLAHMASAFKGAAMSAALDLPGTRKAQIGRLLWVRGHYVNIYGVPEIFSSITRSADMNKTPDVRTRAIVPEWATTIVVEYAVPLLNERSVVNLFAAAGKLSGVGDWRNEKGKGTFGQFVLADPDDETFRRIVASGGRDAQMAAMDKPSAFDRDTEELLAWFEVEVVSSGKKRAA